jgi:hypothetical protein
MSSHHTTAVDRLAPFWLNDVDLKARLKRGRRRHRRSSEPLQCIAQLVTGLGSFYVR